MPASFNIACAEGSYDVVVKSGLAADVLAFEGDAIILHDALFEALVAGSRHGRIPIVADERHKSLDALPQIISDMRTLGANRATHLIALGGGIVQDIASFCAATFMRGLSWSYAPTTLLAMADSCLGGKSSINVGSHKNLVGTIHPPEHVLIDPDFALTLSSEQSVDGLCEAVKICFCRDHKTFDRFLDQDARPGISGAALEDVLSLTLGAKRWFVEIDEYDRAERQLLNFGHTFGHAIESASGFRVSHGCAVGLGMLCAISLGASLRINYAADVRVGKLQAYVEGLLSAVPELAHRLAGVSADQCMTHCLSDKKHERDNYIFILVGATGTVERRRLAKSEANRNAIIRAFADALEKYQS